MVQNRAMQTFTIPVAKCKRCRKTWMPTTEHPTICPHCKSRFWDDDDKPKRGPKPKLPGTPQNPLPALSSLSRPIS